jgi:hypothetical protein
MRSEFVDRSGVIRSMTPELIDLVGDRVGCPLGENDDLPQWANDLVRTAFAEARESGQPVMEQTPVGDLIVLPGPCGAILVFMATTSGVALFEARRKVRAHSGIELADRVEVPELVRARISI